MTKIGALVLGGTLSAATATRFQERIGRRRKPSWSVPVANTGALLSAMRVALSLIWPDAYAIRRRKSMAQLKVAFTRPPVLRTDRPLLESDGDPWPLNVVGHGLFGSEVYQRARQCHHHAGAAFLASLAASTLWEYGIESFNKRPSAIDLAWTPLVGSLVGEGRFRLHRRIRGSARRPSPLRRAALVLVDPLGEVERSLLGCRC